MDVEVAKAINKLSKKINSIQLQLDRYFSIKHEENSADIKLSENGLLEVADMVSLHDEAIFELAEIVSELKESEE